jgi:hypothetical protein
VSVGDLASRPGEASGATASELGRAGQSLPGGRPASGAGRNPHATFAAGGRQRCPPGRRLAPPAGSAGEGLTPCEALVRSPSRLHGAACACARPGGVARGGPRLRPRPRPRAVGQLDRDQVHLTVRCPSRSDGEACAPGAADRAAPETVGSSERAPFQGLRCGLERPRRALGEPIPSDKAGGCAAGRKGIDGWEQSPQEIILEVVEAGPPEADQAASSRYCTQRVSRALSAARFLDLRSGRWPGNVPPGSSGGSAHVQPEHLRQFHSPHSCRR